MEPSRRAWTCLLLACLSATVLAGCEASPPVEYHSGSGPEACAERLHEISGRLLLYYSANRQLPPSLGDIGSPGDPDGGSFFVCPASGNAYLYYPDGLPIPGGTEQLVLCDADRVHNGGRWAILVGGGPPSGPLAARVIWLAETVMRSVLDSAVPAGH